MLQQALPKSHVYTLGALGGYKPQIEGDPWEHAFSYTLYYVWLRGQGCRDKSMSIWTCGLHSAKASRILQLSLTPEPYGLTVSRMSLGLAVEAMFLGYFSSCCLSRGKRLHTIVRFWFQLGTNVCSRSVFSFASWNFSIWLFFSKEEWIVPFYWK